jgi:DNA-binding cell septation regulator SpoVG
VNLQIINILAQIRPSNKPGPVKAYADVQIQTAEGTLSEKGYAIVQKDGSPLFIGFPSRPGNTPGKFFSIVEAEGDIRKAIFDAISTAYEKISK